jgi:hypothetical protein
MLSSPPYKQEKGKRKKKRQRIIKHPLKSASGAFMASSSRHCAACDKSRCRRRSPSGALMALDSPSSMIPPPKEKVEERKKSSSGALMASYSYHLLRSLNRSTTFNRAPRSFLHCPRPLFSRVILITVLFSPRHSRFHARYLRNNTVPVILCDNWRPSDTLCLCCSYPLLRSGSQVHTNLRSRLHGNEREKYKAFNVAR